MTREELAIGIYETAHLTGEFLLRSGVISKEYFDKYLFESNPELLVNIAAQLETKLPEGFDLLGGLEMGGIPIATALSMKTNKAACFVRKEAKKYGTCKFAEGPEIKNKKILVVEDVVTSGGQIVISVNDLRTQGAEITHAVCVIDREAGGADNLKKIGVELIPLFTMSEIKTLV
ncbi:MAG: orotate phosphoribosyltransferase [Candidatus Kapabacteria bacterium]|jgi:orotate phosphoribosyltransferase|nr:orotate phosphoribosyltransferase [Candidatus Kapabacteria bacterium]